MAHVGRRPLHRHLGNAVSAAAEAQVSPPVLDRERRVALSGGRAVALTAKELTLFELLYASRGRLFGRNDILDRVWGLEFSGDPRVVDAYVKRLRAKLGAGAIETVRGLGYRCPLPEPGGVTQPHLRRLPPEAQLLTRLAERVLKITDPADIISSVHDLLQPHYAVREVSLWSLPQPSLQAPADVPPSPVLLAQAGRAEATALPPGALRALSSAAAPGQGRGHAHSDFRADPPRPDLLLVPLGGGGAGGPAETPWALLAFWAETGSGKRAPEQDALKQDAPEQPAGPGYWPLDVRSALDAVAGLVHPALRLNAEIGRRQQAERAVRRLNADLEGRVQARTHDLARAHGDLRALYTLAQGLASAATLGEVLAHGLSLLAQMAGAGVCSLWRLHSTELQCLGAYTPGHHDCTSELARNAPALAALLRQSVACTPVQGGLTRTATTQGGREVLLIPLATALSEVHALHFELPGPVPGDLSLMDAAARAFGLAFERQLQTLHLEQVALSDELTGLPNRRALLADLTAELSYSQRHRTSLTLSLFELQGIRGVNQGQGFAAGNDLIRALADQVRGALRLEDRIYRLGGAVLVSLVRTSDLHEREVLQARLNRLSSHGAAARLTISHASAPDDASELSGLLHLALQRLDPPLLSPPPETGPVRGRP